MGEINAQAQQGESVKNPVQAQTAESVNHTGQDAAGQNSAAAHTGPVFNGAAQAVASQNDNGAKADAQHHGARGIAAQTGQNILAGGLIALAFASILGSAAYILGRRQQA